RLVTSWPDDGRWWLLLGRIHEDEGQPQAAARAYGVGLERLKGVNLASSSARIWTALARALDSTPPHKLEREWLSYLEPLEDEEQAWDGLRGDLRHVDGALLERILRDCMRRERKGEVACCELAR